MRMNVKFIGTAVLSAAAGAAVAWAITADRADEKSKKLVAENDDLRDEMRVKTRRIIELRNALDDAAAEVEALHLAIDEETGFAEEGQETDSENSPGENSSETVPEVEELHVEDDPTEEELTMGREKILAQIREYVPSAEDERVFMEEQGGPVIASTKYDPPFVISQPDYAHGDEGMHHAKITLKWYPNHQVLLDEDDEPITDVDRYCGWRSLNQFGGESGDDDIVYVRNRNSEVDYEVERQGPDEDLPLHVKFGMPQMEFRSRKAAGKIRLPEEDPDE
jgi:hypothetical protein